MRALPVPMAQTGSYATTTCCQSDTRSATPFSCPSRTAYICARGLDPVKACWAKPLAVRHALRGLLQAPKVQGSAPPHARTGARSQLRPVTSSRQAHAQRRRAPL